MTDSRKVHDRQTTQQDEHKWWQQWSRSRVECDTNIFDDRDRIKRDECSNSLKKALGQTKSIVGAT